MTFQPRYPRVERPNQPPFHLERKPSRPDWLDCFGSWAALIFVAVLLIFALPVWIDRAYTVEATHRYIGSAESVFPIGGEQVRELAHAAPCPPSGLDRTEGGQFVVRK